MTTVTSVNPNAVIHWVEAKYAFGSGIDSINIAGTEETPSVTGLPIINQTLHYAVSGGTEKYSGARGGCVVSLVNQIDWVVVCKFTTMKKTFPDPASIKW